MPSVFETAPATSAIPITFATKANWDATCAELPAQARQFALANGFAAKPGAYLALPAADGRIAQVVFGLEEEASKSRDLFRPGLLPGLLPPGVYGFANAPHDARLAALAFALGSYRFSRYRKADTPDVRLVPSDGVDVADITRIAEAAALARDLINTPANDMGPEELASAAQALAQRFGAKFNCIVGDDLTRQNFPLIHAVGMASSRAPRLIDLTWGDPAHPKVTLVGKGVCFDTGGLDLKPSGGMLIMKKDMGGGQRAGTGADGDGRQAQGALGCCSGGGRPRSPTPPARSMSSSRAKGITVEIGNTDAEDGWCWPTRWRWPTEKPGCWSIGHPDRGGAGGAGADFRPFAPTMRRWRWTWRFAPKGENDPLWRLPLWPPYDSWLDSKVATINNAPSGGFAGSITCALFLQRFVEHAKSWLHVDIYGWTPSAKPARPEGGECQAARAIYKLLGQRYG